MTLKIAAAAVLTAIAPAAALADGLTLSAPLAGATLHGEAADVSVYFAETEGDVFEVVASYVTDAAPSNPNRIVMALGDGDAVAFALPGQPGTLYSFARAGSQIRIGADPAAGAAAAM